MHPFFEDYDGDNKSCFQQDVSRCRRGASISVLPEKISLPGLRCISTHLRS
ncbi:hypothetical protein HMPREF9137_1434 [Prevotella denticola F0289]|nr:hypothetical protein HMPREF9137_1434 [Prevotella denticola F0289]